MSYVFYDPHGRRSVIVKLILVLVIFIVTIIFSVMVLNMTLDRGMLKLKSKFQLDAGYSNYPIKEMPDNQLQTPSLKVNHSNKVIAFYVNWDPNSYLSLKQNINNIPYLAPEWLHLIN